MKKIAVILGIRPDVIRASIVLDKLRTQNDCEVVFVWSGQHYDDNLKDIFFRDLGVAKPEIELGAKGESDAELVGSVISRLHPVLRDIEPEVAVFLGDTNTVMGCIAAAQLNIPIVHIEGGMRSYDWRMPEEKYRTTIDHLSDIIYAYFDEYKQQAVREGISPKRVVVTTNLIVDVLERYYFQQKAKFDALGDSRFYKERGIERGQFYLMTCHRRENVEIQSSFRNILALLGETDRKIFFPAGYRTQRLLKEYGFNLPENVITVDPVGYTEMLILMANARGIITDSGTIVEEACVLGVPSVQMRKSTERPQVYDAGASVKFDPAVAESYPANTIFHRLERLGDLTWDHGLGDGKASQRIVADLLSRLSNDDFRLHGAQDYPFSVERSYRGDGLRTRGDSIEIVSVDQETRSHLTQKNRSVDSMDRRG